MRHRYSSISLFSGFFLVIALFFIVRNVGEQKNVASHAAASSTLTFTNTTPQVTPGATMSIDVSVNPGTNAVSLINLVIGYDSTKLNPLQNGFAPNTTAFPQTLDGPIYNTCTGTQCTMYIALSVGNNPTNAITVTTKVATLNFQAVSAGNTQLSFDTKTQIFSVAAGDQANENVLSTASPLTVTIGGTGAITPTIIQQTPIPTSINQASPIPTSPTNATPSPTTGQNPTPTPMGTTINLQVALPGIGINGGNLHPLNPIRPITFNLYNVDNGTLLTKTNSVVFDGSYFVRPVIDLGQVPTGNYQVFISSPQFLNNRLSIGGGTNAQSTIPITNGQAIQVQPNVLIAGDIAPKNGTIFGDNMLDILDYNALLSCYGNKYKTSSCLAPLVLSNPGADFDNNGIVDAIDYNILLRGLAQTNTGDTIPGKP